MSATVGIDDITNQPFILDVDLDYFHTEKSIEPNDPTVFYELIKKAYVITVATEPKFIGYEKLRGENITADSLLKRLLKHFEKALAR
jgi:hypothetical protein